MDTNTELKNKKKKFKPILKGIPDWPVYQLGKNRKEFVEEVAEKAFQKIKEIHPGKKQLIEELESTLYKEQQRMKRNPWRVDPPDEGKFWSTIKQDLLEINGKPIDHVQNEPNEILKRITLRYADEIAGNFKPNSYRFARSVITFWFARLLNASIVKRPFAFFRNTYTLRDKIQIVGKAKHIRKLARRGTVVMVPTHFSNLDSILIGWVIHALGLPAFIYGAGLNLFNIKIFAYFMNSLGAYKVDRRKKNLVYLETLKLYSHLAIMKGCHSLFFPGGTRSRSGMIEKVLKKGLLSTAIEAQRSLYMEDPDTTKKIFIVPVTINYHFVLEAPSLINDYLQTQGAQKYFPEEDEYSGSFTLIKFMFKFFTKGSSISVSIGRGLDVVGNYVDDDGHSIDNTGKIIHTKDYFISNNELTSDKQREEVYTRMLSQKIVTEYHRINRVFASHIAAFIAFEIWKKQYPQLDLFGLLRLPEEDLKIDYEVFKATFKRVRKQVFKLKKQDKLYTATHLKGNLDDVIKLGLQNVGIFHVKRPLLSDKQGNIITQDLNTLYYYHNRLAGYELENFI
ncbi:MAG TPA: 1-acyl-sn-glycerol-3-phosphate acyltransferase [Cyclobacteriaceae bacterium]|nr:1-acyl-sn-glycerol-3-phosphate acyltransferase [Cyclobacteriaceae bacterium]